MFEVQSDNTAASAQADVFMLCGFHQLPLVVVLQTGFPAWNWQMLHLQLAAAVLKDHRRIS
jgi:hypothetical protein